MVRAFAFMQVFTDLFIILVPLSFVLKLKVPLLQKLAIFCIMGAGLVVTVISIIRLTTLFPKKFIADLSVASQFPNTYWAVLELNIALICISAPALDQLVLRLTKGPAPATTESTPSVESVHSDAKKPRFHWSRLPSHRNTTDEPRA
jgi:hypothetical protein